MSHTYSQHYQFVISLSVGIAWDPVRTSGTIWRRAVVDAIRDALEQGRLSFSDQGPFIYNSRDLHRRNPIEHWRMYSPADSHFWSSREELLPDRGNDSKEKRDTNHQIVILGRM